MSRLRFLIRRWSFDLDVDDFNKTAEMRTGGEARTMMVVLELGQSQVALVGDRELGLVESYTDGQMAIKQPISR